MTTIKQNLFVLSIIFIISSSCAAQKNQFQDQPKFTSPKSGLSKESSIDSSRKKAFILNGEGLQHFKNNQNSLAIESFQQAIQLSSRPTFYYNLANVFFKKKQYLKSIDSYNEAIKLNPFYSNALYQKALALQNLKKYRQAISTYSELVHVDSEFYDAYVNRGFSFLKLSEFRESIRDNTHAIKISPSIHTAYLNRAYAYNYLGEIVKACQDWQKACDLGSQKACREVQADC